MPIVQLTPSFVSNATCPEGKSRIEYCDQALPGLLLEVRPSQASTWYLRYKADSRTKYVKLGTSALISLADARKQAKILKAEITANGRDPRAEEKARKAVLTFAEFMEEHYMPHAKRHKRSWLRDQNLYNPRLKEAFGPKPLNAITRHAIVTFHGALPDQGLAPASCDHHLKLLKHALNLAIDWGMLIEKNPAARVPLFNVDNRVEHLLSDEELQRLITVLRTDANRPVCLIMLFLLSTGARLNEALKATWGQIDMQSRTWTIPASNSKSKRNRTVPLNDSAIDVLKQLDTASEFIYLFINRKTGKPYTTVTRVWNRLQGLAKLSKRMRIHDARHTMAQLMCNAGRTLLEVQAVLGHAHYSTTTRYAKLSMATLQIAANVAAIKIGTSAQSSAPVEADTLHPSPVRE